MAKEASAAVSERVAKYMYGASSQQWVGIRRQEATCTPSYILKNVTIIVA